MDASRLSPGERIVVVAGGLLFIDSVLPWFRYCLDQVIRHECENRNAWSNPVSSLAVLLALAMVAQIVLSHLATFRVAAPGRIPWGKVHVFTGFAVLALVVLQVLAGDKSLGYPWSRAFGLYLGLAIAAALAYGGMVRSREPDPAPEGGTP